MILACQSNDPDLYFEKELPEGVLKDCLACPIRKACEDEAYRHGERGWWGGTSEEDRAARRGVAGDRVEPRPASAFMGLVYVDPPRWDPDGKQTWEQYKKAANYWRQKYNRDGGPLRHVTDDGRPVFYADYFEWARDNWQNNLKGKNTHEQRRGA